MLSLSILDHVRFKNRKGNFVTALPVSVEFFKLLKEEKNSRNSNVTSEWKKYTSNSRLDEDQVTPLSDLLHATVALYITSLPKVTSASLYKTVCGEGARTLILLRDKRETFQEMENHGISNLLLNRSQISRAAPGEINNNPILTSQLTKTSVSAEKKRPLREDRKNNSVDQLEEFSGSNSDDPSVLLNPHKDYNSIISWMSLNEFPGGRAYDKKLQGDFRLSQISTPSTCESVKLPNSGLNTPCESPFFDVFSDSEDGTDSNSEIEEEEDLDDFSRGLQVFLKAAALRKRGRRAGSIDITQVGMENRVMAAATFQKNYRIPGSKVVSLILLSVRKKFRKCGLGNFLLEKLKSPSVVGPYDALVVRANNSTVQFFIKNGFTDDIILNSKFREVDESWNDCTLMTYLPPFDGHYPSLPGTTEWDRPEALAAMEDEIEKWKQKSLEAYQAQVTCLTRLQQEVLRLHELLKTQQMTIHTLKTENKRLQSKLKNERRSTQELITSMEQKAADFERVYAQHFHMKET
ncbi:uncharacterized protein LOC106466848 isoform X2 [Limulus polyphemus]|uniref:Uncharacterized protein LOC106466848 isoform X2 n=1 Tax=Limulus polyphemus TaxID=6850 RepID=A0ABM1T415_LIMPO|nr:uncharacterized protein LOC106466848 isoform X2 [Limulus polyphemus]